MEYLRPILAWAGACWIARRIAVSLHRHLSESLRLAFLGASRAIALLTLVITWTLLTLAEAPIALRWPETARA